MPNIIDGVFFDETINGYSEQASLIPKYKELNQYFKKFEGVDTTVVANPGSNVVEELLDSADVFMNLKAQLTSTLSVKSHPIIANVRTQQNSGIVSLT